MCIPGFVKETKNEYTLGFETNFFAKREKNQWRSGIRTNSFTKRQADHRRKY
jgi:hypothetical protein